MTFRDLACFSYRPVLSCMYALLIVACDTNLPPTDEEVVVYIPEVNDEYNPRDIQLRVEIEQEFIDRFPVRQSSSDPRRAIVFNFDLSRSAPWRREASDRVDLATVSLSTTPIDFMAERIDPSYTPEYQAMTFLEARPIEGEMYGLARRTNNRQSRRGGPIDEIFTLEDGNFNFYVECHDPGGERQGTCSMNYTPSLRSSLRKANEYIPHVAIVFQRQRLSEWRAIKSQIDEFLAERVTIVPFENRLEC